MLGTHRDWNNDWNNDWDNDWDTAQRPASCGDRHLAGCVLRSGSVQLWLINEWPSFPLMTLLWVTHFMRRIGSLPNGTHAKRFCDYLVTLSIDAMSEEDAKNSSWDIWIRDEEHLEQAKTEFKGFENAPDDPQYQVEDKASEIRHQRVAEHQRRLKNQQSMRSRQGGGALAGVGLRQQSIPVTIGIIIIAVVASYSAGIGNPKPSIEPGQLSLEQKVHDALSFVDRREYYSTDEDAFASVKRGEIWRLVTPMLLHGDTMHLAFNMIWIYLLGSAIERLHGSVFLAILAVSTHVLGMLIQVTLPGTESLPAALSGLAGGPFAIGASGAVYGLFGYLWIRPNLDPSYPIRMVPMNVALMLGWLVLCIFVIDGVANGAHIGGLIGGVLAAMIMVGLTKSNSS